MKTKFFLMLLLCVKIASAQQKTPYAIIPKPLKMLASTGSFTWSSATKIVSAVQAKEFQPAILELQAISLKVKTAGPQNTIVISKDASISAEEGYKLVVKPNKIEIKVAGVPGAFWAIAS